MITTRQKHHPAGSGRKRAQREIIQTKNIRNLTGENQVRSIELVRRALSFLGAGRYTRLLTWAFSTRWTL